MLKAIIVDDEKHAIKTLEWEIDTHCQGIEIVGRYNDPVKALEILQVSPPDILFLDIEMPRLNGFDLLNKISKITFDVIFVTAYDEYAVKAFRINAVDYLLKPIITSDLTEAIQRVKLKNELGKTNKEDKGLQIEKLKKSFKKIPLANIDGIEFVFPFQILYCKSDGSYTYVIMERKKTLITKSLRELEETLIEHNFLRTHKSFLVNLNHISKYIRVDGGYLVMSNGDKVAVSRRKKEELMRLF